MLLQLDNAGIAYQQGTVFEVPAVTKFSLGIEAGERLGIAGPIGSGKSSLLALMSGIVPFDSGRMLFDGEVVAGGRGVARGSIGIAFQSPEDSLFEKTVFDDVSFAPRNLDLADKETRRRVLDALEAVGLDREEFATRNPFSLSTGEQRRVALAGVLALEPRLLLLDEPTAYLDPATRRDIINRLVELNRERGTAIAMVSHDMDELAAFAERLIVMDGGRKVADGPAGELLLDEPLLQRHGLEAPGTVQLCRLLSERVGHRIEPVLEETAALELLDSVLRDGAAQ